MPFNNSEIKSTISFFLQLVNFETWRLATNLEPFLFSSTFEIQMTFSRRVSACRTRRRIRMCCAILCLSIDF